MLIAVYNNIIEVSEKLGVYIDLSTKYMMLGLGRCLNSKLCQLYLVLLVFLSCASVSVHRIGFSLSYPGCISSFFLNLDHLYS